MIATDAETLGKVWEGDGVDEQRVRLSQFVRQTGQKLRYKYDFGDGWEHELLLEKILPVEADVYYPRCLKGKRALEYCFFLSRHIDDFKPIQTVEE